MRPLVLVGFCVGWIFLLAACTSSPKPAPARIPLAAVSPLPAQPLPPWIASISPHGEAADGAQIRVRFINDLVPVEALEAPDRQAALARFSIAPALPGRFVFLTPRMVGFESNAPIPHATRVRVALAAGLADRAGHRLTSDYAWTFTTAPAEISAVTGSDPSAAPSVVGLSPLVVVQSSERLDEASLLAHATLVDAADAKATVALQPAATPSPTASASAEESGPQRPAQSVTYVLRPTHPLTRAHAYRFVVGAGIAPRDGNVPTSKRTEGGLRAYGDFRTEGVEFRADSVARFSNGNPYVRFSNPIDPATLRGALQITPKLGGSLPLATVAADGTLALDPFALAPGTDYTVTVEPSLHDIFGQSVAGTASATLRTGDLEAGLWAPQGFSIFPAGLGVALEVETTNLPSNAYRRVVRTIRPEQLIGREPGGDVAAFLPPAASWPAVSAPSHPNAAVQTQLDVRRALGAPTGMFAYGVRTATAVAPARNGDPQPDQPQFLGVVEATDIGLFAQWFPRGGFVRAARLSDGSPVAHAQVTVYPSQVTYPAKAHVDETPCASGATAADGTLTLAGPAFANCAATATRADGAPALLAVARLGNDWAFVRTQSYANGNIDGGWSAGLPNSHGALVSDRALYRAGETAEFSAIAYFETSGVLARGKSASYALSIASPSGKKTALGSRMLDAFGAFTVSVPIGPHPELGTYTIAAVGSRGERLDGTFRVAYFRPPNFSVALALDRDVASPGSVVTAASTSTYLFGSAVEGGNARVNVTRRKVDFVPKGRDAFTFGRTWLYPEEPPSVTTDVLQQDVKLDAGGYARVPIPVATDVPFALAYRVDAQTTDISNLAVSDTKSFTVLPGDALIGLRGAYFAHTGTPFSITAIVTDARGAAQPERHVVLRLQRREYVQATQIVAGGEVPHDAVHYVDVATKNVTSSAQAQTVSFSAASAGEYRVRANFADAKNDATATDQNLWIAGSGDASWGPGTQDGYLTVKLDKATYRPGDIATALVQSPFRDAQLFFAVIRHDAQVQRTLVVHGAAPVVHFRVTADMLPNAAVEAVLVRRGAPLARAVPANLSALARTGFAPFHVDLGAKYLKVAVRLAHPALRPGAVQTVTVRVRDATGRPVRAQCTVAVVNDAILQLTGYRFPDVVASVYADQPISTVWADNRDDVRLATERRSVEKGFGYGGGLMSGAGTTRVRTNFKPLAFWNGGLRTDARGEVTFSFGLPDDLTTWRVMVLTMDRQARFGNADVTFVAMKPLVTDAVLPPFARPGDRFAGGVVVTNVAHAGGDVSISGALAGGIAFAADAQARAHASVSAREPIAASTQAYRFDMRAGGTQTATATFTTHLGPNSDAFAVEVPIVSDGLTATTASAGVTQGAVDIPVDVDRRLTGPLGGLDVTLASTLLGDVSEPARALAEPRPPFAQTLASRIAIAADEAQLDARYGRSAERTRMLASLAADLAALRTLALPEGGYAAWPGAARAELYTTAFIATQLQQAKLAGVSVAGDLAQSESYLRKELASPDACRPSDALCNAEARLEALETLGTLGIVRSDFLPDIVKLHDRFGYYEQVELARQLLAVPEWRARGLALRDTLMERVNMTARGANANLAGAYESPAAGQAQIVRLLLESHAPGEDVDRAVRSLLELRRNGTWGCRCDDAEALSALVLYTAQETVPPNFTTSLRLPSRPPRSERDTFAGYGQTLATHVVSLAQLTRGPSHVTVVKHGSGTLHYVVAFRYPIAADAPGAYQGLRIDRFVRDAGRPAPLASFGLARQRGPTTLVAGRVFDIEDRIVVDHPVDDVLVVDALPAGVEAVDQTFRTSLGAFSNDDTWVADYQTLERARVLSFVHHLEAGVYAFHYLTRTVTPGTFAWPAASVSLENAPDEFGRTAAAMLVVAPNASIPK